MIDLLISVLKTLALTCVLGILGAGLGFTGGVLILQWLGYEDLAGFNGTWGSLIGVVVGGYAGFYIATKRL